MTWFMDQRAKKPIRAALMVEQNGLCGYCRREMTVDRRHVRKIRFATIDHIVPIVAGGTNDTENLILCCRLCNIVKGHASVEEFIFGLLWVWICKKHPRLSVAFYSVFRGQS